MLICACYPMVCPMHMSLDLGLIPGPPTQFRFEPKIEAVAVMKHAIHENEALRKLAKNHHRCR